MRVGSNAFNFMASSESRRSQRSAEDLRAKELPMTGGLEWRIGVVPVQNDTTDDLVRAASSGVTLN